MEEATLLFPLASVVLVFMGIPLWIAMIAPNRFYGVRTAATLADESLWYAVNRAAGRDLVVAGALTFALSVLLPDAGVRGLAYVLVMAGALAACVALVALIGLARVRYLRSQL